MHNSSTAPGKGSWIKNLLGTNTAGTTNTENTLTLEYLKQYFNAFHPKDGTALNIIASLDDPNLNKINLINKLISDGANKYKALEFALKNNTKQAEYLLNNLTFEPNPSLIQALHNKSLTLVKYFVEEKGANVNYSHFGSNTLSIAAGLAEPYKTDITCYLLTRGAIPSNTSAEEADQNATDYYKHIFFKAVKEENFTIIENLIENTNFNVDATCIDSTALSSAINFKDQKIAKYLISKKADTTAAMAAAATKGNLDGIKLLLKAEANIDGNKDESPLMLASEHGYTSIVKYLLEHGAKHNVQGWCVGAATINLYTDVNVQVKKLLILWEKVNNTNIESPELIIHFQNILNEISQTSISSNYDGYKNLSLEQIKEQFPKFLNQLYKDVQKFTEIKNLLEDYSSGKKVPINTNIVVDDEGYVSDHEFKAIDEAEPKLTKTGSRLEHTPSKSGIFHTFSLEALDEDQASLGGDIKYIFDSEF